MILSRKQAAVEDAWRRMNVKGILAILYECIWIHDLDCWELECVFSSSVIVFFLTFARLMDDAYRCSICDALRDVESYLEPWCGMSALGIADVWDDCRALWGILRACSCFTAYNLVLGTRLMS